MDTSYSHSIALMDKRRQRDCEDGLQYCTHASGRCGGYAGLCGACHADEHAEMLEWASDQPDPLPDETPSNYWHRIGGKFYDAWWDVATARMSAYRGEAEHRATLHREMDARMTRPTPTGGAR